jgi:hypothetical protein
MSTQTLQTILINYIASAKGLLSDEQFATLDIKNLQRFCGLLSECISFEHLTDPTLARHGILQLQQYNTEEAVMHVFLLYIYKLSVEGTNHPLERGIIRQKIIGILPIFERAAAAGLIRLEAYDKNADALAIIADNSDDIGLVHTALANEYLRLAD